MKNKNESAVSSSENSKKLRIDFYESGVGETIVVTFPSGGLALIDAHPSLHSHRPEIAEIVRGKTIHFVCLTHPHADHGIDLVPVLERHDSVQAFWHTIFDVPAFIYGAEQMVTFPSEVRAYAKKMNREWAGFLVNILSAVSERKIPRHLLRSDESPKMIDGVEFHCLSPSERTQNEFFDAYRRKLTDPLSDFPEVNHLSAVLALRFGETVVLLGADALKPNWKDTIDHFRARGLPKARVLKIPHHGAKNALELRAGRRNYLDICSREPRAITVLFAGDAKHPNPEVFEKIRARTDSICLSNGRKAASKNNPLGLNLPGARAVGRARVCNPIVSVELDSAGGVRVLAGTMCRSGCFSDDP